MRRRQRLTILALVVLLTSAALDAQAAPESEHNQISSVPVPNGKDSEAPAVFAITELQPGTTASFNLPAVTQATLFDGDYSYSIRVPRVWRMEELFTITSQRRQAHRGKKVK